MQVVSSRTAASSSRIQPQAKTYLSLYQDCPDAEIALEDFEQWATARLNLLRTVESLRTKGLTEADPEYLNRMKEAGRRLMPLRSGPDALRDRVSHFVLRLAYCRTEDLRNWLLSQETHLLRFRLEVMSDGERADFMGGNGIVFEQLSSADMSQLRDKLMGLSRVSEASFAATKYYRVPFQQALSLVAGREVYLQGGWAFVPLQRLVSTVVLRVLPLPFNTPK
jgi:DNA primase large subunit